MNVIDYERLKAHLIEDEGEKLKPYRCTSGKTTIGVGRNLDDKGISQTESRILLANDIADVELEMGGLWPWLLEDDVPQSVRLAVANMLFNMGAGRLRQFVKMFIALDAKDYDEAARQVLDSAYARQVKDRAIRVAADMRGVGREGR